MLSGQASGRATTRPRSFIGSPRTKATRVLSTNLAVAYRDGEGVAQNAPQAYMWYSLSMTAAWDPAIHEQAGKERDELAKTMSSAQVTQAQAEAAAWQPTTGASTLPHPPQ